MSSQSLNDPLNIIHAISEIEEDFPSYNVHDVISGLGESHKEVCNDVSTWLKRKNLKYPQCHSKAKVNTEVGLKEMGDDQWLKRDKRVDVAILFASHDIPSVQIEVESSKSVDHTLFKLMCGLVNQLRYFMNRSINISEVTGFFVPVDEGYVRKVVCSWSDMKLMYCRECFKLKKDDVFTEIRDAFMKQSEFEITGVFSNEFTFPLSPEFVKENFATDAYQMKSGNSVVILCPSERSVYKSALTRGEDRRLHCLLRNFQYDLQYSSLPIDIKFIGCAVYYKYIALNMPLKKEDALKVIPLFVKDVVEAITELHDVGMAHLDIRLENVCYNDSGHAILIDLGRSVETTEIKFKSYGNSLMYCKPYKEWTAQNADWRQLAMMVHYILNKEITDYHKIEIDRGTYPDLFLCTMFSEGKALRVHYLCSLSLFVIFCRRIQPRFI